MAAGIEGYLSVVLDKASSIDLTFSVTTTDGTAECELTVLLLKKCASLLQNNQCLYFAASSDYNGGKFNVTTPAFDKKAKLSVPKINRDALVETAEFFTATLVPPEGHSRLLVVVDPAFIEIVDGTGGLIQDLSDRC